MNSLQSLKILPTLDFVTLWPCVETPPKGETQFQAMEGGFSYASDLVALIRENFPAFGIGVGGYPEKHPEASDHATDLRNLKTKVDAGADFITTQLFFDNRAFFQVCERLPAC